MSLKPETRTQEPDTQAPSNAYTDAPTLHASLILGAVQLLFWLFFHPSAWRSHVARTEPDLRPDFCLVELSREQWRSPVLPRLLVQGYIILPLLGGAFVALVLWALEASDDGIVYGVAAGVAYGIAYGVAGGVVGGVAYGIVIGVAGGVAGGVAFGVSGGVAYGQAGGVAVGLTVGVAGGVAGGAAVGVSRSGTNFSWARQIGGIIAGVLIGSVAFAVALVSYTVADGLAFGMAYGVAIGAEVGIGAGLRVQRWRHGVMCGLAVGVVYGVVAGLAGGLAVGAEGGAAGGLAYGVAYGVAAGASFALPYALAGWIAGPGAGATAGALGGGGAGIALVLQGEVLSFPLWLIVLLGLAGILLGLTFAWWRPVLLYPFVMAWNSLLYRAEERRPGDHPGLLRLHSAFWDEHQRLPLFGLDDHLVLVMERNPAEGHAALEYLSTSRQRWAAQAAQIELDARDLERCASVEAIRRTHHTLAAGELTGPAASLLRSFSRVSQDTDAALRQESAYNQRLALNAVEDRLDGLLRELTRSNERYANRFRSVANRWRQVVADHIQELAQAVEARQEIDSPYVIGVPLTAQQEIFVGRGDVSARIEQLLLDRRRPPLLLYGQRRMGKTSLLNNLGRLLPSTIVPLFVDLQGPASLASDHAGLLYNIARGMVDSANRQRGLILPPLTREALASDPFTRFDEWLDEVERHLGTRTALLLLDEFETLDSAMASGRFAEEAVLGTLRHWIQHRPHFKVLISGSHTLDEVQQWASYLINVQLVRISYLRENEARQLVERPAEGFALRYEPGASQRILDLTRCHPFLVQLLCAEIVALKNEQPVDVRRLARVKDVEAAVPEALERGSFFFADIERNQVDATGLALLRILAVQGEGAAVSRESLAYQLADPDELDRTLDSLTRRELIEPIDDGCRFQVELIRRWFAA
jgi:hypothetical protein